MGLSNVPWYWYKNAPHVYELIVEYINYLWLLSIYDILVHKQNKYHVKNHFISASSFCVVMKKAESVSTVLSLPYAEFDLPWKSELEITSHPSGCYRVNLC